MTQVSPNRTDVIDMCPGCGAHSYGGGSFCTGCGAALAVAHPPPPPTATFTNNSAQHAAVKGLGQMLGLHPIPAVMTLAADAMVFGGTIATGGAIWPLALGVAAVLGFITYKAQMRFYGDDSEAAMIKGLSVFLLSAIPTGLPGFLTVPSAVVGVVHMIRRKD